ncbi:MAG: glutamate racemase [Bacteroidota bacterium]|nr:glutamate racemase [Bacteroidota bacterium]
MKIGVFDSGYGGLTVFKEFIKHLPEYDYIYLGDNARTPYGTRSFETIYRYTLQAVKKLFELDCELVILACNTASAKALPSIQKNDLPNLAPNKRVLGVIRPTVEAINKFTKTNTIGILGTSSTIASESYALEIEKLFPQTTVVQQDCPMCVPLVENNEHNSDGANYFVKKYITQLLSKNKKIDTIVLACTHYPLLMPKIRSYLPKNINILSQGKIVASSLTDYLDRHPEIDQKLSKNSQRLFFTTDVAQIFSEKAKIFLNIDLKPNVKKIELD